MIPNVNPYALLALSLASAGCNSSLHDGPAGKTLASEAESSEGDGTLEAASTAAAELTGAGAETVTDEDDKSIDDTGDEDSLSPCLDLRLTDAPSDADTEFGRTLANAGDINDDGIDDLIMGASYRQEGNGPRGRGYILFGSSSLLGAELNVRQLAETGLGIVIKPESSPSALGEHFLGWAVAGLGDVNGDGIDDFGLTAPLFS